MGVMLTMSVQEGYCAPIQRDSLFVILRNMKQSVYLVWRAVLAGMLHPSNRNLKQNSYHCLCYQESTESEIKAWAEPIASVADIDQDPNIVDSDDEFVIDEIVVDEIDDFELVQEPTPPMSTFQHQPESQAVPERSIAEPPIGIEEPPVASQGWVVLNVLTRSL